MARPDQAGVDLLQSLAARLGERAARGEPLNQFLLPPAIEAARSAGLDDLARRMEHWLAAIPGNQLLRGLITNFVVRDPETIRPRVRAVVRYDEFARAAILARCHASPDTRFAVEGDESQALASAVDDYAKECVLVAMALVGQVDRAFALATETGLAANRGLTVPLLHLVAAIELARSGDCRWVDHAPSAPSDWDALHLARGMLGIVPWEGYPFADY